MGGSNSKTIAESFNNVVTEVVARNITSCVGNASQEQIMSIRQIQGDVVIRDTAMKQIAVVNADCMQNVLNNVDVQNQIISQVVQSASTETYAMLDFLSGANSTSEAMIANMVSNLFTSETITDTTNIIKQRQMLEIVEVGGNVLVDGFTMEQSALLAAKTLVENSNIMQVMNELEQEYDQSAQTTAEGPFDFISDIFSNLGYAAFALIAFIIFIIIGAVLWRKSKKDKSGAGVFGGAKEAFKSLSIME